MRKEFAENINFETMAKLTDEMLKYQKNIKQRSTRAILLKAVPAVAAIVLIIGLVNFMGVYDFNRHINPDDINSGVTPAVTEQQNDGEQARGGMLISVPRVVEKAMFERFMQDISKNAPDRVINKFEVYYNIKTLERGEFYVFDENAADREAAEFLEYWNEYTSWSDVEYQLMLMLYQLNESDFIKVPPRDLIQLHRDTAVRDAYRNAHSVPYEHYVADEPEYAHVRFGANRDVLLLEVEWHDVHSYALDLADKGGHSDRLDEVRALSAEYPETDEFIEKFIEWYSKAYRDRIISNELWIEYYNDYSEEEKETALTRDFARIADNATEILKEISDGRRWYSKTINGIDSNTNWIIEDGIQIPPPFVGYGSDERRSIEKLKADCYDYYGYVMHTVYPTFITISHIYENGEHQFENFGNVFTQEEFNDLLETEMIPHLDDLLERGSIAQEDYNWVILDPFERAVKTFFRE